MKPSIRNRAIRNAGEQFADRLRTVRRSLNLWRNRRSLIGEILVIQMTFALVLCASTIAFLWWTSGWVVADNLQNWGRQWISELDDLGMPLYASQDEERFLRIEKFVNAFPEIAFVRYYSETGEVVFTAYPKKGIVDVPALTAGFLAKLAKSNNPAVEQTMSEGAAEGISIVRVSKPIWTTSLPQDGLLGFDPDAESMVKRRLVGYAELGLDFRNYEGQLNQNIVTASLLGVVLLLLLTLVSSTVLRRALMPLSELQTPLQKLAKGSTDFEVESTGHTEIAAIADALNTTVTALNERDKMLWQLANRDSLTGLVSRHRFSEILTEELEEVSEHEGETALLFVDLDQFKYINDTLGHAAGDRFLKQAAARLEAGVRKEDTVSRFGGDEFTILVRDVSRQDVDEISDALVKDMRDDRFIEDGQAFSVPCSIGVTMFDSDATSPAELMAQADMACHEAKAKGRNRHQFYKTSGREMKRMAADVGWSQQIQRALKEDLFVMQYQPIVCLRTGKPTHYEALLRLRSDDGRLVPPMAFLPAANRFGLMQEVDEWVIRNVLSALSAFRKDRNDLRFTLNISGTIFENENLYRTIERNLVQNNLPPDSIVLEITEQVAVQHIGSARKQIESLSKLGCKFAIDDFGAGHSSYSYLKTLPVDYIKIDGSFIHDLATDDVDKTIVRSISEIAKATNKQTIAEHVGNAQTFDLLLGLGVDFAQGFYVGEPTDDLTGLLAPRSPKAARKSKAKGKTKRKTKAT
jgi:diguanylate cyclase (GGDEF)-like protein